MSGNQKSAVLSQMPSPIPAIKSFAQNESIYQSRMVEKKYSHPDEYQNNIFQKNKNLVKGPSEALSDKMINSKIDSSLNLFSIIKQE